MCGFVIVGIIGEVWLTISQDVISHNEAFRITTFYLLTTLTFGLGAQCRQLNLNWLVKAFYGALFLNILFIVFKLKLPAWLLNYYYPERSFEILNTISMTDLENLLSLARPRGIFSNPNVSALMINLISLFIYLSFRNKLLELKLNFIGIGIILLPIFFSLLFSSRGEFIVSALLAGLYFVQIYKSIDKEKRRSLLYKLFGGTMIFVGLVIALAISYEDEFHLIENVERIGLLFNMKSESNEFVDPSLKGGSRALLFMEGGNLNRILSSPLFGTGYSVASEFPFNFPTKYNHQDWIYMLMTSGVLGVGIIIFLLKKIALPLGWPVLIPWVLPGFVNSFVLVFPAFMFYWFMIGLLKQKIFIQQKTLFVADKRD